MSTLASHRGIVTLLAGWAVRLRSVRPRPAAAGSPEVVEVWLACHTTTCAHLSTRHDRTPAGLVCRACGTPNGGAQ
ncbi:hypothetical protein [Streptomyces sp. NPDC051561]|uniref:hypothetical protein n=1 Tax=Streptomyces sp. NPDC051561 TaxID=3365658 RepID=UPI0037ACA245